MGQEFIMKKQIARWFGLLALVCGVATATTFAGPLREKDGLAALRELNIDAGRITLVEYSEAPTMATAKGRPSSNLPPRNRVKIVLNPAKRSNIHIEVWLPKAGTWNGQFVGLGNGGAAGSINPGTLAGPFSGG